MAVLKMQGEKTLGAPAHWGGEMAFVLLLSFTGGSGLALLWRDRLAGGLHPLAPASRGCADIIFAHALFKDGAWFLQAGGTCAERATENVMR